MKKSPFIFGITVLLFIVGYPSLAQTPEPDHFPLPELEIISPKNADRVTYLGHLEGFSDWALFAAFSPDGALVAATGFYSGLRIWNVETGTLLKSVDCPENSNETDMGGWTGGVAFSPNSSWIALACGATARLWNVSDLLEKTEPEPIHILKGSGKFIGNLAVSRDGRYLAASTVEADPNAIWLWEIETEAKLAAFEGSDVCCPNFSPDDPPLLAYADDKETHLFDIQSLKEIAPLSQRSEVFNADWSLSADIVTGYFSDYPNAKNLRLWNLQISSSPVVLRTDDYHSPDILTFNPDGSLIASGSEWYHMLLWDSATHKQLAIIQTSGISSIAFSPDGKLIVTTHAGSGIADKVQLWGILERAS